jgi:hypothetical protein
MFTQDQLMLREHAIRGAIAPILWENPGYRPMDQEITLYIFNVSQMDMAPRGLIGSTTKKTERIYDFLIRKEVGESCLFGLKVLNGCHESMINLVCNDFEIS